MISITFESFIIQIEFAKCPFSIFTKNEKKLKRKNYDKYGRLPNLQLLISLFFATEKKKKEGIDTIQLGKVYRIYLAMSNQLSAFCGCISGFWDLCPWQQTAGKAEKTFITCILQPVHFVGEMRMRGSFQCLTKPMTWRLLHETLLCLSFLIFSSSCLWLQLQISKTCNIFWFLVIFLGEKRFALYCSYYLIHWVESSIYMF